ncbi:DUF2254 domain-containing protein [Ancylobacter aquaticus]|uniref:DUF2254 domain-containing protein n=1 Tax=Ancylobacter aquaticus TaxID=100 RepID=UPI001FDFE81B|nr:DUF2254 domain-containing protein [Ancylobacter aquaticus]
MWDRLRSSFWFLPSTMAAGAAALSFALVWLDTVLDDGVIERLGWLYGFGPEGARAVLSAVAGSMITVAGLTFSMTMLTLQLASSQFGPRLLRSFMSDRGNQLVLGTFTSTFLYCLLVLRTVRGTEEASFVPHISVTIGVVLATLSLAVLIYFIHHIANSIRIETVLAELARETQAVIDRLYPTQLGQEPSPRDAHATAGLLRELEADCHDVFVEGSGYVQRLDEAAVMRIATEHDLMISINAPPGRFVTERDAVLRAAPRARASDEVLDRLREALVVGRDRTPTQDLHFALRRFVEIAQRALSPGINDPTTALYCIDRLSQALCSLAEREFPSAVRADEEGHPRVITPVSSLEEFACPALVAVARYGMNDADVVRQLVTATAEISAKAGPGAREALRALGGALAAESRSTLKAFDGGRV